MPGRTQSTRHIAPRSVERTSRLGRWASIVSRVPALSTERPLVYKAVFSPAKGCPVFFEVADRPDSGARLTSRPRGLRENDIWRLPHFGESGRPRNSYRENWTSRTRDGRHVLSPAALAEGRPRKQGPGFIVST